MGVGCLIFSLVQNWSFVTSMCFWKLDFHVLDIASKVCLFLDIWSILRESINF
jgi:hypothetical protein